VGSERASGLKDRGLRSSGDGGKKEKKKHPATHDVCSRSREKIRDNICKQEPVSKALQQELSCV
jgi:hypothetical protein